jgi:hypothetical protein
VSAAQGAAHRHARAIRACPIPEGGLLLRYRNSHDFTDCYTTDVAGVHSHAAFVNAFYTTWLFKIERWILKRFVAKPSTDAEAAQLARGTNDTFAAWRVEARASDQVLMCDFLGNTRSWLMVVNEASRTRLYFGSAVVARVNSASGERSMGASFRALLGFHRLYSRALLLAARSRLERASRRHP